MYRRVYRDICDRIEIPRPLRPPGMFVRKTRHHVDADKFGQVFLSKHSFVGFAAVILDQRWKLIFFFLNIGQETRNNTYMSHTFFRLKEYERITIGLNGGYVARQIHSMI